MPLSTTKPLDEHREYMTPNQSENQPPPELHSYPPREIPISYGGGESFRGQGPGMPRMMHHGGNEQPYPRFGPDGDKAQSMMPGGVPAKRPTSPLQGVRMPSDPGAMAEWNQKLEHRFGDTHAKDGPPGQPWMQEMKGMPIESVGMSPHYPPTKPMDERLPSQNNEQPSRDFNRGAAFVSILIK